MKNKGFIYILTLMIITLLAVFFYFMYSFSENSLNINFYKLEKIQSKYMAESAINAALSNENIINELEEFAINDKEMVNLKNTVELKDTKIEKLTLYNKSTIKMDYAELKSVIKYKKSDAYSLLKFNFVNKIYKEEDGVLNTSKIDSENIESIRNLFINNNYSGENLVELNGDFNLDYKNEKLLITEDIEYYDENTNEIIKEEKIVKTLKYSDIIYQDSGTLNIKKGARIGLLIINDKVIFNDNNLFGIIILNKNASIYNNCKLKGYLIDLYDINNSINTIFEYRTVKSYGKVLPEFIKIQTISLNHYDLEN